MPNSVLVPMDGRDPSHAALRHALAADPESDITVLHVTDRTEYSTYEFMMLPSTASQRTDDRAAELFDEARRVADEYGTELSTASEEGSPPRVIVEYAAEHGTDHIVMGSLGRSGLSRLLFGSVAERVIRRSPVPVTVVGVDSARR